MARATDQDRLDALVKAMRDRTFGYEEKPPEAVPWSEYTKAQIHEINDALSLIRRLVDQAPDPDPSNATGPGRPREYKAKDLAKAILMQQYLQVSDRVAQGWSLLFQEKLGLSRAIHYKAIERAYANEQVKQVLGWVFDATGRMDADQVEGFTLDGSGLPTSSKANWESQKTSNADAGRFDGAVVMLTVPNLIATAYVGHPVGKGSEAPTLAPLVETTAGLLGGLQGDVTGDAAFLSRDNCQLIEDHGARPRLFPKRGISPRAKGSPAWRRMLLDLLEDPQAWLRAYHQRSLSEAFWSRDKHRNPGPLRRRIAARRATERHSRFTVDNITRLAYLERMGELGGDGEQAS